MLELSFSLPTKCRCLGVGLLSVIKTCTLATEYATKARIDATPPAHATAVLSVFRATEAGLFSNLYTRVKLSFKILAVSSRTFTTTPLSPYFGDALIGKNNFNNRLILIRLGSPFFSIVQCHIAHPGHLHLSARTLLGVPPYTGVRDAFVTAIQHMIYFFMYNSPSSSSYILCPHSVHFPSLSLIYTKDILLCLSYVFQKPRPSSICHSHIMCWHIKGSNFGCKTTLFPLWIASTSLIHLVGE
jgi:hypothetical protein